MIKEAREAVAGALAPLGIPIHRYPAGAVTPPAAALAWGSPLYERRTGSRAVIGLDVHLVVSSAAGASAQAALDALVDSAVQALVTASGIQVDQVSAPSADSDTATLTAVVAAFVSVERT